MHVRQQVCVHGVWLCPAAAQVVEALLAAGASPDLVVDVVSGGAGRRAAGRVGACGGEGEEGGRTALT